MICAHVNCENELDPYSRQRKYCSQTCKKRAAPSRYRRALKQKAIEYKGGECINCGYNKCPGALEFHHVGKKTFGISSLGHTRKWERVKKELDKCVLLCANCHREVECGMLKVSASAVNRD